MSKKYPRFTEEEAREAVERIRIAEEHLRIIRSSVSQKYPRAGHQRSKLHVRAGKAHEWVMDLKDYLEHELKKLNES